MRHIRQLSAALLIALVVIVAGCKEGGSGGQSYLAKGGEARIRIAVIPFDSPGVQTENAARVVNDELVTSLIGTKAFDVVEPGIVYAAITDVSARNLYGLDLETMKKLQEKIGPVRAFIVGMVQEYGEVRVGPVTYPSISVSARVLDSQTGSILWAGSVSRTGADTEKLFGMGAVHSPGRLTRSVVATLIASASQQGLAKFIQQAPSVPSVVAAAPVTPSPSSPTLTAPSGKGRYMDETLTYTQGALSALFGQVDALTRGPVEFREHHFPIVATTYGGPDFEVAVRLVDCLKRQAALERVKHDYPDGTETKIAGLPAYAADSSAQMPGAYRLSVAAGRFALMLEGPSQKKSEMELIAQSIVAAMQ